MRLRRFSPEIENVRVPRQEPGRIPERIVSFPACRLRVWGSKAPTMADDHQWTNYTSHAADMAFRLIVMQRIAHDLKTFFATEPELPPRLQTLLRKLDEQ